jgi:hypothetical protein
MAALLLSVAHEAKNHVARGRSNQLRHLFAGRFDHRLEF